MGEGCSIGSRPWLDCKHCNGQDLRSVWSESLNFNDHQSNEEGRTMQLVDIHHCVLLIYNGLTYYARKLLTMNMRTVQLVTVTSPLLTTKQNPI